MLVLSSLVKGLVAPTVRRLIVPVHNKMSLSGSGDYPEAKMVTPFKVEGEVVKGFGRGSKELNIPTANFSDQVVSGLPSDVTTGIYFGWAKLEKEPFIRKAVISIGWNPYYKNVKKSVETHIIHDYGEDSFYGEWLKVLICGYLRPEKNFESLDSLITAIRADIKTAADFLDKSDCEPFKCDQFFYIKNSSLL